MLVYLVPEIGSHLMIDLINNKACDFPNILPNTNLTLNELPNFGSYTFVIQQMIALADSGQTFMTGFLGDETVEAGAEMGSVYGIATLASYARQNSLGDNRKYPYFSRTSISTNQIVSTTLEGLLAFSEQAGLGWTEIALLADTTDLAIDFIESVISQAKTTEIHILQYRSFLRGDTEFDLDLNLIKDSGARIIVCAVTDNFNLLVERAHELGLIGEHYVWILSDFIYGTSFESFGHLESGMFWAFDYFPESHYKECFSEYWRNADPEIYPLAGNDTIPPTTVFDLFLATAIAVDTLDKMEMLDGQYISPQLWSDAIRNINAEGLGGQLSFTKTGDRIGLTSLKYYDANMNDAVDVAIKEPGKPLEFIGDIVWFSNTTEFPDLDIRPPFHYWSCDEGKKGFDKSGKKISLHTPDSSDVDDIDSIYHCDYFIDCKNFSDESKDCPTNYTAIYISFGIIIGILLVVVVGLSVFVLIFGVYLNYKRLRAASPFFLNLLLLSIFVGIASNFAFFGKPHPVSCGFQPWLLGLPTISMIAVLASKNFRIYRIFRFPLQKVKISDWELLGLWVIIMIPAVIILIVWSIVSIPTAKMEEFDGVDHFVCSFGTTGFVFFFIFVGYSTLVLIFGAIISILSRNTPSLFNESKLLTISIYNLGFLGCVIIPVFFVLNSFNPFLAWILRTCAVLYAFSATMILQFVPRLFGIFVLDKGKDVRGTKTFIMGAHDKTSSTPN